MIKDQAGWDKCVNVNTDPYGKACVDVAREVMRILDEGKDFDPRQIIRDANKNISEESITGFMAGCVAETAKIGINGAL